MQLSGVQAVHLAEPKKYPVVQAVQPSAVHVVHPVAHLTQDVADAK